MNENQALSAFSALSGATRLRMLKLLVTAGADGMTAGEISAASEATPSRASFHLSAMAKAGLVTSTKDARQVIYRVDFQSIGALIDYLLVDCCSNNATVLACCGAGKRC